MWSSEPWSLEKATSPLQALSAAPGACQAKYIVPLFWLLHITPMLPPNATRTALSSSVNEVAAAGMPEAVITYGATQVRSSPLECVTYGRGSPVSGTNVTQSTPAPS